MLGDVLYAVWLCLWSVVSMVSCCGVAVFLGAMYIGGYG